MGATFDWSMYKGNVTWLRERTLFLCRHGSHAYGTAGPDSDLDVRGVFTPPGSYVYGFLNRVEQVDKGWEGVDACLWDVRRFLQLAVECNPNVIELLWVDESDWIEVHGTVYSHRLTTQAKDGYAKYECFWKELVANRDLFLSQQAKHRFCGYAISQLKRIETHRRWLLHPPTHQPTRAEHGLPDYNQIPKEQREAYEASMRKVVEGWQVDLACLDEATRIDLLNKLTQSLADMKLSADDQWVAAGNKFGLDAQAMEYLKAERSYRSALAEWTQYQTWLKERNPVRAALEARFGYDTKHAMHLVRLMRMAREILEGKGVIVKRPDAQELLDLRHRGTWPYEKLVEWARAQDAELTELLKTSPLPKQPDRLKVDRLCQKVVCGYTTLIPNPVYATPSESWDA